MRSQTLVLGPALALALTLAPAALAADEGTSDDASVASMEDPAPAPESDSAAAPEDEAAPAPEEMAEVKASEAPTAETAAAPAPSKHVIQLGPKGYDSEGHEGRIHIVVTGDTLWDISDAYLGTPWVWPSVWTDNELIENPHLIYPGDYIWVSANEMRKVTPEEAEALLAGSPAKADETEAPVTEVAMDVGEAPRPPTIRFSEIESASFVTVEDYEASASIVDSLTPRKWLGSQDVVTVGLGRGEVEVGEQFTVFRARRKVYDPDTNKLLGVYVQVLGWMEVDQVHEDVAQGEVRISQYEMQVGDRVLPRERVSTEIELVPTPASVQGRVVYFPDDLRNSGTEDLVFLDQGAEDGVEVGNTLEVYRPVGDTNEPVRDKTVHLPDRVVAKLVVVSTQLGTSVALVKQATTEVEMGDKFRAGEF